MNSEKIEVRSRDVTTKILTVRLAKRDAVYTEYRVSDYSC